MLSPDVILVGASVRSLAESVISDGQVPFCVDYFADSDLRWRLECINAADNLRTIRSYSEVVAAISDCDLNVPIVLAGGAECDTVLTTQLSKHRTIAGMPPEVVKQLRSPEVVFQVLRDAGCRVPDWQLAANTDRLTFDPVKWLVKDMSSSGGLAVFATDACATLSNNQFLQRRLAGTCFSASFYSESDALGESPVLLGVTIQLSGQRALNCDGFKFCGNVGPVQPSKNLRNQVCRAAAALASKFQMRGVWGIDFILNNNEAWIIEVNPRVTASHELHEKRLMPGGSECCSHVQLQLRSVGQGPKTVNLKTKTASSQIARMVVYASESLMISEATQTQLTKFVRHETEDPSCWIADIPQCSANVNAGDPLCSVYLRLPICDASSFQQMCLAIPADTSKILSHLVPEIQEQTEVIEKVNNFSD